jgi:hypothetical protein
MKHLAQSVIIQQQVYIRHNYHTLLNVACIQIMHAHFSIQCLLDGQFLLHEVALTY